MPLVNFKSNIQKEAVENHWHPDQIQYAEDYIHDLFKKGIKAKRPPKLDDEKANYIEDAFSKKSD